MSETASDNTPTIKCPNCGAPNQYDGKGKTMTCGYCGDVIPVPEEYWPPLFPSRVAAAPAPKQSNPLPWLIGCVPVVLMVGAVIAASIFLPRIMNPDAASAPTAPAQLPAQTLTVARATAAPTPAAAQHTLVFGSGPGKFTDTRSIAVDGGGYIYVGEYTGGRIQVFDSSGKFISQFFAGNSKTLLLGMAVDYKGNVYVADGSDIAKYDGRSGALLGKLAYAGGPGFGELAASPDGGLIGMWYQRRNGIFTSREGAREDLVKFNADGKVTQVISAPISAQTESVELENAPAVDGRGNIYVLSRMSDAVFVFNPEGKYVSRFGSSGSQPGQFQNPAAIAVDSRGYVYIADSRDLSVFDGSGRFVGVVTLDQPVSGMAFDANDDLYIASRTSVERYTILLARLNTGR